MILKIKHYEIEYYNTLTLKILSFGGKVIEVYELIFSPLILGKAMATLYCFVKQNAYFNL